MDVPSFDELLSLVEPLIRKEDTGMHPSISPSERLSITLRYLVSGNSFEDLIFMTARSPQAIGKLVIDTCEAIILCLKRQQPIKTPKTPEEWIMTSDTFKSAWHFPNCLGAIDGKLIPIKKSVKSGSFYFNYKKFFSIVLMDVVNNQL
ncbi:uncharacterized protein [Palaemon carinicauda]|uniref:uncharacterized protein n=1 Tax=Palaemon carinicauda TaxID=392227 RepID=UPI0035B65C2E